MIRTLVIEGAPGSGRHKLLQELESQTGLPWFHDEANAISAGKVTNEYILEYGTSMAGMLCQPPASNYAYINAELRPLAKLLRLGDDFNDEYNCSIVDQVRLASDLAYASWDRRTTRGCRHNLLVCVEGYHDAQDLDIPTELWSGQYRRLFEHMQDCMGTKQPTSMFCRHLWSLLAPMYDEIVYVSTDQGFTQAAKEIIECLPT